MKRLFGLLACLIGLTAWGQVPPPVLRTAMTTNTEAAWLGLQHIWTASNQFRANVEFTNGISLTTGSTNALGATNLPVQIYGWTDFIQSPTNGDAMLVLGHNVKPGTSGDYITGKIVPGQHQFLWRFEKEVYDVTGPRLIMENNMDYSDETDLASGYHRLYLWQIDKATDYIEYQGQADIWTWRGPGAWGVATNLLGLNYADTSGFGYGQRNISYEPMTVQGGTSGNPVEMYRSTKWNFIDMYAIAPANVNSRNWRFGQNLTASGNWELWSSVDDTTAPTLIRISVDKDGIVTVTTNLLVSVGNIGVKTTAPFRSLDVNNASGYCMRLIYNDSDGSPTTYADFLVNSAGNLLINPSAGLSGSYGSVGFGQTTPTHKVDIQGTAPASDVFTGTGIDDLSNSGTFTGTDVGTVTYTVVIVTPGAPDTYKWKKNAGAYSAELGMTGGPYALSDGITVDWGVDNGHTANDQWVITVYSAPPLRVKTAAGAVPLTILNDGTVRTTGALHTSIATGGAITLTAAHSTYLCNVDGVAVTLPTAVGCEGRQYVIKAIHPCENLLITNVTGAELIDGALGWTISDSNVVMKVQSDNARWWIINQY